MWKCLGGPWAPAGCGTTGGTSTLGRHCRLSSERLRKAIARELAARGCRVIDVGVVPTPLLYYSVFHLIPPSSTVQGGVGSVDHPREPRSRVRARTRAPCTTGSPRPQEPDPSSSGEPRANLGSPFFFVQARDFPRLPSTVGGSTMKAGQGRATGASSLAVIRLPVRRACPWFKHRRTVRPAIIPSADS